MVLLLPVIAKDRLMHESTLRNSLRSKEMGYAFMRGNLLTEIILRILGPIGGIKRAMECHRPLWLLYKFRQKSANQPFD